MIRWCCKRILFSLQRLLHQRNILKFVQHWEALRDAKVHLEHAAHDFGGHRVEAIKAIDDAIRQLEICLQYDKH